MLTFNLLDKDGKGEVDFKLYERFWIAFMHMYGEIMHQNMNYSEESEQLTKHTFDTIANI